METLEDIRKYLQQNGVCLKDISTNIEYEALLKLKSWVNQEDKELAMDWDQFQDCVTIMFENYCTAALEIHQKLDECADVRVTPFYFIVIFHYTNTKIFFLQHRKALLDHSLNSDVKRSEPTYVNLCY